ncbi:hypothetical protein BB559_001490 [Furculomyces boomerangus]|uniref:Translation initiation factor eIF2B subunit epsilon n=2 Tax=Harpellales TaxID=61421 RepID=A0A2T9Z1Q4_9FUNG|nr:hypothetical protein BB559_001490 [Furculomyces boomerangus]PVZ98511.1 hypothetical protein BB558_005489 [Smittium angustum]
MREMESENILQAVIIAEAFNDLFKPLTMEKPRCLLPLCNYPMLEYILEFLLFSNVQEVFIYCRSHPDQIKQYINESKWSRHSCSMKIRVNVAKEATSAGDFMRVLDSQSLIKSDFILCSANIVANINMEDILKEHRERKLQDKNQIMTLVLKEALPKHRLQGQQQQTLYFTDPQNKRILHVETMDRIPIAKRVEVPKEIFKECSEIEVLSGLVDSCISICSLDVLALFTENFDYQTIIGDFVKGILTSDLLSSSIYAHVVSNTNNGNGNYATGIQGTRSYASIASDIVSRWTYPMCPEILSTGDPIQKYSYRRGNVYIGDNVKLARKCNIGPRSILGHGSVVEDNATVVDSVLGNSNNISTNSVIRDSHLFGNVSVGKNCFVSSSLVGENVKILDGVTIERGCIIGNNVVVGPNIKILKFTKIFIPTKEYPGNKSSSNINSEISNINNVHSGVNKFGFETGLVGSEGKGSLWVNDLLSDEWESDQVDPRCEMLDQIGVMMSDLNITKEEIKDDFHTDSDYSEESDNDSDEENNLESEGYYEAAQQSLDKQKQEDFKSELYATIKRAFDENHSVATAALELNTLRMAVDGNLDNMRRMIIESVMTQIELPLLSIGEENNTGLNQKVNSGISSKHLPTKIKPIMQKWAPLIAKNIYNSADITDAIEIVFNYIIGLFNTASLTPLHSHGSKDFESKDDILVKMFLFTIRFLYEYDVFEGDSLISWHENKQETIDDVKGFDYKLVQGLNNSV